TSFRVCDTIHPCAIARLEASIDIKNSLFIIASKSGTTLESNLLYRHFLKRLTTSDEADPYGHFLAITDPTTVLEQASVECGFLPGVFGKIGIGGRYSAFSAFGMMPALLMDLDVRRLLSKALDGAEACGPSISIGHNPGAKLGAFLAACANSPTHRLGIHL